jgi:8-oxo-dGTP pyrophosphatase MutT (NUDIX family)
MKFNIVFSEQPIPHKITKSIFLAGPSPRTKDIFDWRHNALSLFEKNGFDGTVFIPVPKERFFCKDDSPNWTYDNQVEWECKARNISDIILFWLPRDIKNGMPAFTTNIEFGEDIHSGKIIYGRPDNAEKCRYLDKRILEIKEKVFNQLDELIQYGISKLGIGATRIDGEVNVPLFIWESEQFQGWYSSVKNNGNKLVDAKLLHHVKFSNGYLFSFILWVNVWVNSEQRFKSNEFVFSRKDISVILPYYKENNETYFISVKEFRSPVRNNSGLVYELPGGSALKPGVDPLINAQHELSEEIGLHVDDVSRFKYVDTKQICATLSSHVSALFKIELTKNEFESIKKSINEKQTFGLQEDTEIIYLEIVNSKEIMNYPFDFSMIGMILGSLINE